MVKGVATNNFFEDMNIDTEEATTNLKRAFCDAEHGLNRIDFSDAKGPVTDEEELRRILGW